ncbi:response regulator transcription factor [Bacillus bingmayongensis]|uniref:response regulator transcription factor n=1 Tax=Bacillus bingmayongensis TaxID=1150157 RepID=UPI00031AF7B1|nr:response regulator transcription factor [Bacillus bingmayongensis]MBY0599552.1 response regulator transcription factor [Bacillus bingmayongensis]
MKRILAIEEHSDMQKQIQTFLVAHNYKIDIASSGTEGILKFQKNSYDLILLDSTLPDIDGYSTCQIIRGQSNIPIIMLSGCNDEKNEIKAFELGIDDYIIKPFHHTVFIKRMEAVLRRGLTSEPEKNMGILQFNELMLNFPAYTAYINGEKVELTTKEFEIIAMLLQNQGTVLSRSDLLDKVWGYEYYGDVRVIDTHIKNLRKKLNIPYIKTVKGIGYKLDS